MFRNPTTDLIVVLVIVLLIFGPKRLPGLGKQLGQGIREFKDSITGDSKHDDAEDRPALSQASANPAPSAAATHPAEAAQPPAQAAPSTPQAAPSAPPQAAPPAHPERQSAEVGSEGRS